MFDHLVKVYKHSDHTIVNEVVQCLECKRMCWNSRWWWNYEYFRLPMNCHHTCAYFNCHWQYSSWEKPTKILTICTPFWSLYVMHNTLCAETHLSSEVGALLSFVIGHRCLSVIGSCS